MIVEFILLGIIIGLLIYYYVKSPNENFDTEFTFEGCKVKNNNMFKSTYPRKITFNECKTLAAHGDPYPDKMVDFGVSDYEKDTVQCHYDVVDNMSYPNTSNKCIKVNDINYGIDDSIAYYSAFTSPNFTSNSLNNLRSPSNSPPAASNSLDTLHTPVLNSLPAASNTLHTPFLNHSNSSIDLVSNNASLVRPAGGEVSNIYAPTITF